MKKEIMEFIKDNDVKFIRLAFSDLEGQQKNVSIMADSFQEAVENGVPFEPSLIRCFSDISSSDLYLVPDLKTVNILPWRPSQDRVIRFYCDIFEPTKKSFVFDTRAILKKVAKRVETMGYTAKIGTECEFYLFLLDEKGNPTMIPHDEGECFDISPLDKGENIRREICLTLDEMGLKPLNSHHESGHGQHRIEFLEADALDAADHFMTYKSVVKAIASKNGLFASFMPKPFANMSGSGLHINLSLLKDGENIFKDSENEHSKVAESFIAGVLSRIKEITAFLNSSINSYERLGLKNAPKYITWSHQNIGQLIRIPKTMDKKVRMELRSPDSALNPYLAFSLIISAGLDGIENNLKLDKSFDVKTELIDEEKLKEIECLPESLSEAIDIARKSEFLAKVLGEDILNKYLKLKSDEVENFEKAELRGEYVFEKYFKKF